MEQGAQGSSYASQSLDHRIRLRKQIMRIFNNTYEEAHALAKFMTACAVAGMSEERMRKWLIESSIITLESEDRYMMKQMGMDEAEYEMFILDLLLEKYHLWQPEKEGSITDQLAGNQIDKIILDDVESHTVHSEEKVARNTGMPAGHAAPYQADGPAQARIPHGQLSNQLGAIPQLPTSQLDSRMRDTQAVYSQMTTAYERVTQARKDVESTNPLQENYMGLLHELHNANCFYLSCVRDYLNTTSYSLGSPIL